MRLTSGDLACSLCASALSGCDCMESAVSTESTYTGGQSSSSGFTFLLERNPTHTSPLPEICKCCKVTASMPTAGQVRAHLEEKRHVIAKQRGYGAQGAGVGCNPAGKGLSLCAVHHGWPAGVCAHPASRAGHQAGTRRPQQQSVAAAHTELATVYTLSALRGHHPPAAHAPLVCERSSSLLHVHAVFTVWLMTAGQVAWQPICSRK